MNKSEIDREDLATTYLEQLEFTPYPVQEDALLSWFTCDEGLLVCTPTGTGKTLIAEAAIFEALHTGQKAYYTTPLIALTEQKLQEIQASAVRWGFSADDVGLVTGNRRVNPDAPILVVVAEILFNRLLRKDQFDFENVSAVVMDEFHSFNDRERGIVWEFSLGLLPKEVRLLLLSATVGNSVAFVNWMQRANERKLELVQSDVRKIPLTFNWVGDQLLNEQIEELAKGGDANRFTPALIFCFNRDECWNVAEQLKGKNLITKETKAALSDELQKYDWTKGSGPKLRQILQRGIGVHHAGLMPHYKRIVETLFQQKLLAITVCTETLAAGINLPARSVVIPNILKGPPDKKKLIEASAAHQMFGRAGRPQYDDQGFVFGLAHEDDVKILRWREKYDQIPEDTKDPGLRKAKKALKKKMPTRRANQTYWTEQQFEKLRTSPPANLESRGQLPWRFIAHMLEVTPDVSVIRHLIGKRLMSDKDLAQSQKRFDEMLYILWKGDYVRLEPTPKEFEEKQDEQPAEKPEPKPELLFGMKLSDERPKAAKEKVEVVENSYKAEKAFPTERLALLNLLRGVNPLYGLFAVNHLGIADHAERLQVFESLLEMPGSVAKYVRVPKQDELPPGPLATTRLDVQLLQLGLATPEELGAGKADEEEDQRGSHFYDEERTWVLTLAEKLRLLFNHDFPGVRDFRITPVWAAGELLEFGGDFNKFITSKRLQKQEGIIFRHLLRLILLIGEFHSLCPPDIEATEWQSDLDDLRNRLIATCREVDPQSVDTALQSEMM